MITDETRDSIEDWARKEIPEDFRVMVFLALAEIEEKKLDWNTASGRKKVISELRKYKISPQKDIQYNEGIKRHNPQNNPDVGFLREGSESNDDNVESFEEYCSKTGENSIDRGEDEYNLESGAINKKNQLSFEIVELLKELDDKSYKSGLLANLDTVGRLKLIRRASILAYRLLQKTQGSENAEMKKQK